MGKSELFNPPLGPSCAGGGAFPVRRGEHDREAIQTGVQLVPRRRHRRDVPGGHAAAEGAAEEASARRAPGAARIALVAGVPLVPAAIRAPTGSALSAAARRLREPVRSTTSRDEPARDVAKMATDRLMAAIDALEDALA